MLENKNFYQYLKIIIGINAKILNSASCPMVFMRRRSKKPTSGVMPHHHSAPEKFGFLGPAFMRAELTLFHVKQSLAGEINGNLLSHASPPLCASRAWLFGFQRSRWRPFPQGSVSRGTLGENPEAGKLIIETEDRNIFNKFKSGLGGFCGGAVSRPLQYNLAAGR